MKKILFIIIILIFNNHSYSFDLFETDFYEVEFISNNIQDDKINKLGEIKKQSLLNIFKKTLDDEKYNELYNNYITDDFINSFIKNIIINDEKIINNKYLSRTKINFDKKKIINFFREKKIPYIEYYPEKFLLIIYEEDQISNSLFSKNNKFYSYINDNIETNNLFKLPNLDINDRFILKKENIINKDFKSIKNFSQKYNLNEIIIVIAKIDEDNVKYDLILYSDGLIIEKKLKFNKYNFKEFFKILEFESLDIWKKLNHIENNFVNIINCKVNYFNILELKEIRNKLNNVSNIESLNIKSMSYKNIEYDIYYYGSSKIFINIIKMNNLNIIFKQNLCFISLK